MNRFPFSGLPIRLSTRHLVLAGLISLPALTVAEEGGSGHYLPGSMASFVDAVPPEETFITRFNFATYSGDFSRGQPLPIAGLTVLGVNADSTAAGLTMLWRPPVDIGDVELLSRLNDEYANLTKADLRQAHLGLLPQHCKYATKLLPHRKGYCVALGSTINGDYRSLMLWRPGRLLRRRFARVLLCDCFSL